MPVSRGRAAMTPAKPLRTLIVIPTYNEAENIAATVTRVHVSVPEVDILIVDDSSPDGTGQIADDLAAADARVFVLHRTEKAGLGAAYLAGFAWALERDYAWVGEFDADGSHPADALPRLMAAMRSDAAPWLVIGSRWVEGGSVVDWPVARQLLSRGGNAYARVVLRLEVRDVTAGYRLYRSEALRSIQLDTVASKGYCFQVDLALRVHDAGQAIVEVPIEFRERELGTSKMSRGIVAEAMAMVTVWALRRAGRAVLPRALPREVRHAAHGSVGS